MAKKQRRATVRVSEIRRLSMMQCTEREAAAKLGIQLATFREMIRIDRLAKEAWEYGREHGRVALREAQFELAKRYPQMAIFLGKQYLGQTDVQVLEHSGRDGGPIKTLDLTKLDAKGRQDLRDALRKARVDKGDK